MCVSGQHNNTYTNNCLSWRLEHEAKIRTNGKAAQEARSGWAGRAALVAYASAERARAEVCGAAQEMRHITLR